MLSERSEKAHRGLVLIFALTLALFALGGASDAQVLCPAQDQILRPIGFQQLTVSTVAVGLTVPDDASLALAYVDGAESVRYRADGAAPTTLVGHIAVDTATIVVCRESLTEVQFIRDGATDATLEIHYFGD